jgi:hypothetical protein
MPKGMRGQHQCKSCVWCDELFCTSCSDAGTPTKYCSQECEADHDEENPPKFSQGQQADEYYERETA